METAATGNVGTLGKREVGQRGRRDKLCENCSALELFKIVPAMFNYLGPDNSVNSPDLATREKEDNIKKGTPWLHQNACQYNQWGLCNQNANAIMASQSCTTPSTALTHATIFSLPHKSSYIFTPSRIQYQNIFTFFTKDPKTCAPKKKSKQNETWRCTAARHCKPRHIAINDWCQIWVNTPHK